MSKKQQVFQLFSRIAIMVFVFSAILLLPAQSWAYWQAWVYLAVFFGSTIMITFYFINHDPGLMERRLRWKEPEKQQQISQILLGLLFLGGLLCGGLDFHHHWLAVTPMLVFIGDIGVIAGFIFAFRVYQANPYAGTTVEVEAGQRVISTGPYAIVRHPLYACGLPLLIGTPIALGSYWSLLFFIPIVFALVFRIQNEEKVLLRDLPGYREYCQQVRWHLIPFVW